MLCGLNEVITLKKKKNPRVVTGILSAIDQC